MKVLRPLVILGAGLAGLGADPATINAEPKKGRVATLSEAELNLLSRTIETNRSHEELTESLKLSQKQLIELNQNLKKFKQEDPQGFKQFIHENRELLNQTTELLSALEQNTEDNRFLIGPWLFAWLTLVGIVTFLSADLLLSDKRWIPLRVYDAVAESSREELKAEISTKLSSKRRAEVISLINEFKQALKSGSTRQLRSVQRACLARVAEFNDSDEVWASPELKKIVYTLASLDTATENQPDSRDREEVESLLHDLVDLAIRPLNSSLRQFLRSYSPATEPEV
ncbi:MAG: hypothetical protein OXU45_06550 [Candidatus Melainabacteria bacterium]|nr:hypothetical protein [Candidatus Melainabacteria bacterium]